MTLFLVIFILESLKFKLFFQRKHGEGCGLIDLTSHLQGRNYKSSHVRTIYMHRLTSSPQTLPNTSNNGIKQITKEKIFQLYQCCEINFFKRNFSTDIFFVDFLYADNLFYQNGTPPPVENNGPSLMKTNWNVSELIHWKNCANVAEIFILFVIFWVLQDVTALISYHINLKIRLSVIKNLNIGIFCVC